MRSMGWAPPGNPNSKSLAKMFKSISHAPLRPRRNPRKMTVANEENIMRALGRLPACGAKSWRMIFSVLLATLAFPMSADADNAKDIRAGEALAMKACLPCHVIPSHPSQQQASPPSGPPFEEIAKGSKAAPEALRVFLLSTRSNVSHPGAMPNPGLTEDEIPLISAYLASLRKVK